MNADNDIDIKLMLQVKNGDNNSFEQLVNRNKQKMFALAYRFLGNYQDAEDVAQESFIKIYNSAKTYQPLSKFTTWMYKICKNTCIKKLRQKKTGNISLSDHKTNADDIHDGEIEDKNSELPEQKLLKQEKAEIVKKAIDSLGERQRLAVILYRYENCSYEEIAEIMNCSSEAVKSILHRARVNLKNILKNYLK